MATTRAAACAAALFFAPAAPAAIVPEPNRTVPAQGAFQFDAGVAVKFSARDAGARAAAGVLRDLLHRFNGLDLQVAARGTQPAVEFARERGLPAEGYHLTVDSHGVRIGASDDAGLFYGAVSLWQLLPEGSGGAIPAQRIDDAPRFAWRGLMLDSSRHFQSPEFIRRMIEWMALHKLNVLHWHLTDDQGWRIEIRQYPRLTDIGAWRGPDHYGGYYTQAQIRELVAFATTRHVRIVPEIDLPGHATAAIAAYPELGAASTPLEVSGRWGVHTHLLNLEPATLRFLDQVFTEVLALFPSPVIHVGGDEVVTKEWAQNTAVQARARSLHLQTRDVQHYFTGHVGRFLKTRGRRMVGWDEILTPALPRQAIVMSWRGVAGARAAAVAGNDTVLSPDPGLYFDHRQSPLRSEPPGRLAPEDLRSVYEFEPVDASLTPAQRRHVLGLQANLWTEHIRTEARVEWMALPRAAAVAEVGWSRSRDWPRFLHALPTLFRRYEALGLNYADSVFGIEVRLDRLQDHLEARLANLPGLALLPEASVHVTLDGRDPQADSPAYRAPLVVRPGEELRAATFLGATRVSRVVSLPIDAHAGLRRDTHELERCSDVVGLLLEPRDAADGAPLAVDIMNPCWWRRGVDLTRGARVDASVAALPFNYEFGADAPELHVGDGSGRFGALRIHADRCDAPPLATLPFAAPLPGRMQLTPQALPPLAGRHDLCLEVTRPAADPLWALDWIEITE